MGFLVRPYEPSDAQRCCDVINDAIDNMDGLNDEARTHVRGSNTSGRLGSDLECWTTVVVVLDDQVVGLGALDQDELKRIYVDPGSQRSGAATALMSSLEEIAHALGVRRVRLDASPSSVGFYEALG